MKLTYWLTKDAIRRAFVEDGKEVQEEQSITINAAEISKAAREWLAMHSGRLEVLTWSTHVIYGNTPFRTIWFEFDRLVETPEDIELLIAAHRSAYGTGEATVNAAIDAAIVEKIDQMETMLARPVGFNDYAPRIPDWFKDRPLATRAKELARQVTNRLQTEQLANITRRYAEYIANPGGSFSPIDNDYKQHPDYPAALALYEQATAVSKALAAERERAIAAEKAQRETEKAAWIAELGSAHLQKAFAAGYNSQRQYVTERAAIEFPGYAIDFDDNAGWKARSFPSAAALTEAERVKGEVVWLTSESTRSEDWEEDEEREAVVIQGYLGKYDLIK